MHETFWVLLLGLGLVARSARAEDSPGGGARLSYVRAANAMDCIAAPALERQVVVRMGRDPFTGPPRQWIEALLDFSGGEYTVQLFERDPDGKTLGTRTLRAPAGDCHQLDEAMVLAIALIIDPTLPLGPALTPSGASPGPSVFDNIRLMTPEAASISPRPALSMNAAETNHPASANPTPRSDAFAATRFAGAGVTASAVAVHGVLPGLAPGVEAVSLLPLEARGRYALRWSALYLPEKREATALADLGYGLTALEAGACLARPGHPLRWFACSALGVGAVHTVVHSPVPFGPGDRLWLALRLEAGLGLRLGGPVWAEARLFDLLAAQRRQFRVRTSQGPEPAFSQAWLMPGMAFGLGLSFD